MTQKKQEEVEQKDENVKDNRDRDASDNESEDVYYQDKTRSIGTTAIYRYNTSIRGNGNWRTWQRTGTTRKRDKIEEPEIERESILLKEDQQEKRISQFGMAHNQWVRDR